MLHLQMKHELNLCSWLVTDHKIKLKNDEQKNQN